MDGSAHSPSRLSRRVRVELERLRSLDLYRERRAIEGSHGARIVVDGRACANFCSNDYLGLAADPRLAQEASLALSRAGTGSGAAALVSGYNVEHARLEEELAAFVRQPRALLFSSGWAANVGALRALLGREDLLLADERNHASLIDGGRLSGARYVRIAHADVNAYANALAEPGREKLIATDSVFSMDGDLAPLAELAALRSRHDATLMIDDAHGFGVIGEGGRGALHSGIDLRDGVDVYVATLGKALGCSGAFVAGSAELVEYLVQRARSWVFSTAPPPAIAAAARVALRIAQSEPERRETLFANIQRFRAGAAQSGIELAEQSQPVPIQPLILGEEARALRVSRRLFARGFWVAAIRPPTVPRGTARLRVTLSAAHEAHEVDGLVDALADALKD